MKHLAGRGVVQARVGVPEIAGRKWKPKPIAHAKRPRPPYHSYARIFAGPPYHSDARIFAGVFNEKPSHTLLEDRVLINRV